MIYTYKLKFLNVFVEIRLEIVGGCFEEEGGFGRVGENRKY